MDAKQMLWIDGGLADGCTLQSTLVAKAPAARVHCRNATLGTPLATRVYHSRTLNNVHCSTRREQTVCVKTTRWPHIHKLHCSSQPRASAPQRTAVQAASHPISRHSSLAQAVILLHTTSGGDCGETGRQRMEQYVSGTAGCQWGAGEGVRPESVRKQVPAHATVKDLMTACGALAWFQSPTVPCCQTSPTQKAAPAPKPAAVAKPTITAAKTPASAKPLAASAKPAAPIKAAVAPASRPAGRKLL